MPNNRGGYNSNNRNEKYPGIIVSRGLTDYGCYESDHGKGYNEAQPAAEDRRWRDEGQSELEGDSKGREEGGYLPGEGESVEDTVEEGGIGHVAGVDRAGVDDLFSPGGLSRCHLPQIVTHQLVHIGDVLQDIVIRDDGNRRSPPTAQTDI